MQLIYFISFDSFDSFFVILVSGDSDSDDDTEREEDNESAANRIDNVSDDLLMDESGKLVFLMALLDNLKAAGHRCLVFSQSVKMLNMINRMLKNRVRESTF